MKFVLENAAELEELEVVAKAASAFTAKSRAGERLRSIPIFRADAVDCGSLVYPAR